jgi:hypothetical protein
MSPVSASLVNGSANLEVPDGSGRVITVDAVPDWPASQAAEPQRFYYPREAYGGIRDRGREIGETVNAVVQLRMTESRLLLPLPYDGYTNLAIADSIDSLSPIGSFAIGCRTYGRSTAMGGRT